MTNKKIEITHTEVIEPSHLYLDLSDSLLTKIDLFLSNTNLSKDHQKQLVGMFEEVHSEGYTNALID